MKLEEPDKTTAEVEPFVLGFFRVWLAVWAFTLLWAFWEWTLK